jgi:hypothetical protein
MDKLTLREGLTTFISSSNKQNQPIIFKWNPVGSKGYGTLYQSIITWLKVKPTMYTYNGMKYNRWDLKYKHHSVTILVNGWDCIILPNLSRPTGVLS